jgi:hypothetical protein
VERIELNAARKAVRAAVLHISNKSTFREKC